MATWTNATITSKGYALQAKLLSTDKLDITRVVSGSGRVAAGQLVNQTAISNIVQALTVESLTYDGNGNAKLRVLLSNEDLTASYVCNQIGIYATDPDEGEILFAIAQEATNGHSIPSIAEQPLGYNCGWLFTLTYSNAQNISVTIDPANALTVEAGDERYLKLEEAVGKRLDGKEFVMGDGTTVTAAEGAEIFNDYRTPKFDESGVLREGNLATGEYSSARGARCMSSGECADASGYANVVSGMWSSARGSLNKVSGSVSDASGCGNQVIGQGAAATGYYNTANGLYSSVGGYANEANGDYAVALGLKNTAKKLQFVIGRYADTSSVTKGAVGESGSVGALFVVGNGTSDSASNAFRLTAGGSAYAAANINGTGADLAFFYEWEDGNPDAEDRIGLLVTLNGKKIRKATAEDTYVLGIVSHPDVASFVGGNFADEWQGKYLKDIYGRRLTEVVKVAAYTDEKGVKHPEETVTRYVLNPEYDPNMTYIGREDRPEWDVVALKDQNVVIDDGTCEVNSYCWPGKDGIATASAGETKFRVMERLDGNHILVCNA